MDRRVAMVAARLLHQSTPKLSLGDGHFAYLDEEDYLRFRQWRWMLKRSSSSLAYAVRFESVDGVRRCVYLHREILGCSEGESVDHVNGNGLDNRRRNLRIASPAENSRNSRTPRTNTSGYKGVTWQKHAKRWRALIAVDGKRIHLGYFDSKDDAARAYDEAAAKHHGAFARPNRRDDL